jgi:hypothetical protein
MVVGDEEAVRPDQLRPAAGNVPFAGDGAERAGLVQDPAERVVGEAEGVACGAGEQPLDARPGVENLLGLRLLEHEKAAQALSDRLFTSPPFRLGE